MADTEAYGLTVEPAHYYAGLVSVACWQGQLETLCARLRDELAGEVPKDGRYASAWRSGYMYRPARNRLLIRSNGTDDLMSLLRSILSSEQAAVSDLSHAWQAINLSGQSVPVILSRCLSVDCSEATFAVGSFMQTNLQDAQVLLHRESVFRYTLLVQASYSRSVESRLWKIIKKII